MDTPLIKVETAELMAQILPALILLLVLEGHRFKPVRRENELAILAMKRQASRHADRVMIILANMVAVGMCVYFVQQGPGHLAQLAALAEGPPADQGPLIWAQISTLCIFLAPTLVFLFLIPSIWRKSPLDRESWHEEAEEELNGMTPAERREILRPAGITSSAAKVINARLTASRRKLRERAKNPQARTQDLKDDSFSVTKTEQAGYRAASEDPVK